MYDRPKPGIHLCPLVSGYVHLSIDMYRYVLMEPVNKCLKGIKYS